MLDLGIRFGILDQRLPTNFILGNMVTIMSPEGKPIQVNASALQAAAGQNAMGMLKTMSMNIVNRLLRIVNWFQG